MQANDATKNSWRRKIVAGALIVLGLAAIGLPNSQAQMDYSGGFVPYQRVPPSSFDAYNPATGVGIGPSHRASPPYNFRGTTAPSPEFTRPPSYFPDNDSYYPSFSSGAISITRSNYPETATEASVLPFGISAAALPWSQPGFKEYDPFLRKPPAWPSSASRKYILDAAPLPLGSPGANPGSAMLIVHLPDYAMFWVEGRRITLNGQTSYFNSPPLAAGKKYLYSVRAAWFEDGHWVSLTREVPVEAGLIQALYLRPSPAAPAKKTPGPSS